MTEESLKQIFKFTSTSNKLKNIWRYSSRKDMQKDSTAGHSWHLAFLSWIIADEIDLELNKEKVLKIALVHDLVESITGDIDYVEIQRGNFTKEQKEQNELNAIEIIKNNLPEIQGKEIYTLWQEYEHPKTQEGKFVKAMDKIEALVHLAQEKGFCYDAPELIPNYADKHVKNSPKLIPFLNIIKQKLKEEFIRSNIEWKKEYNQLI